MTGLVQTEPWSIKANCETKEETRNANQLTRLSSEINGDSHRTKYKEKQKDEQSKVQNSVRLAEVGQEYQFQISERESEALRFGVTG